VDNFYLTQILVPKKQLASNAKLTPPEAGKYHFPARHDTGAGGGEHPLLTAEIGFWTSMIFGWVLNGRNQRKDEIDQIHEATALLSSQRSYARIVGVPLSL